MRPLPVLSVDLDVPDPNRLLGWQDRQLIPLADHAADKGACDYGSKPTKLECSVDRQPRRIVGPVADHVVRGDAQELLPQLGNPRAGDAGDAQDGRSGVSGRLEQLVNLELGELDEIGGDQVGLCQGHNQGRDFEQVRDGQVLTALGHHAFGGGDHQEPDPDSSQTSQGVVEEPLVAGDVDETDLEGIASEVSEPDVDRDAPLFLLGPPVAVDACEGLDEGGLSVVDVAQGADHEALECGSFRFCDGHELLLIPDSRSSDDPPDGQRNGGSAWESNPHPEPRRPGLRF